MYYTVLYWSIMIVFSEHEFVCSGFQQIDLKKMPLGKLSRRQIENAYTVLGEAQQVGKS